MPSNTNREFRSMELRKREVRDGEEKNYIVEGYATTFEEAYELYRDGKYVVREMVSKEAFKETDHDELHAQVHGE